MTVVHNHLKHLKDCRMMGIINVVKLWILPVDRQCILCQIIRSDREEIHFLCQFFGHHDGCRSLDHNTKLDILVRNLFLIQFFFHFLDDLLYGLYLCDRNDHREHDGDGSVIACPIQCTKLCLEYLAAVQADTDRTVTHCRIIFFVESEIIHLLIRTDIECTDDDFLSCHCLGYLAVCCKLFFLGWIIPALQIKEFASEQSDAAGIICQYRCHIPNASDICIQVDLCSVLCDILLALEFLQQTLFLFILCFLLLVSFHNGDRWINDDLALVSIYDTHFSIDIFRKIDTDQCRDIHGTGQNRGMGIGRAVTGDEGKHLRFIKLYSLTWCQIIGK